jgi:hypothetical protein
MGISLRCVDINTVIIAQLELEYHSSTVEKENSSFCAGGFENTEAVIREYPENEYVTRGGECPYVMKRLHNAENSY